MSKRCQDCSRCSRSAVGKLVKGSVRVTANVGTLGVVKAIRKRCRMCGHPKSAHRPAGVVPGTIAEPIQRVVRLPISNDTKMFVWRRDEGRCVMCGSRERLEYDHIIPVVMGGSSTARNIQLLCERCNRQKGGHLT